MSGAARASEKDLLYTCSCVPEEVVLAAGFRPRRFLPEGRPADAWVHPKTCGYVKNILAAALDSEDLDAVGIIIANSCDAMRRLYDLWTGYVPHVPAFFLDVPKKSDDASIAFFVSEFARLSEWLHEELRGTRVTGAKLGEAARTCNQVRSLMGEVFGLQAAVPSGISGARVFDLCLAGTTRAKADFASDIRRLLGGVKGEYSKARATRIVVAGGLNCERHVVAEIERAGADIVALDTCIGLRHYEECVEEAPDQIAALARRYLSRRSCSRMEGLEQRLRCMTKLADDSRADGVIYCSLKFCDPCLYDVPLISRTFRERGTPFLWLEDDYASSSLGQMRTRIDAFLEIIEQEAGGARC
jgi:benzoyl-CoA reductase/2-hydroxyglutaryl-CoA dehydratase subunit BcrC/BadD/HgdB